MKGSWENLFKLTLLSIGFLMIYTAYTSMANIVALRFEKNGYGQLGSLSVGWIYITWAFGSVLSATLVRKLGPKYSISSSTFANSLWCYSAIMTTFKLDLDPTQEEPFYVKEWFVYLVVLSASTLNGFLSGPMWVSAMQQVSDYATEENYAFYFSYFWVYYISSQIVGNQIAAFVFERWDQTIFYIIMGTLSLVASIYQLFIPYHEFKKPHEETPQEESLLTKVEQETQKHPTVLQDIKNLITVMTSSKMMCMIPQIFYTGISISYYTGHFVSMLFLTVHQEFTENESFSKSMNVMTLLGLGAFVGTLGSGQAYDRFGNRAAIITNLVLLAGALFAIFAFIEVQQYNYLAFLMVFLWGTVDSSIATHSYSMIGYEFDNSSYGYSIYSIFQSIGVLTFSLFNSLVTDFKSFAILTVVVGAMGFVFISLNFLVKSKKEGHRISIFTDAQPQINEKQND